MITVASRTFRSTPHRDAMQTWRAIVDLLTRGQDGPARRNCSPSRRRCRHRRPGPE